MSSWSAGEVAPFWADIIREHISGDLTVDDMAIATRLAEYVLSGWEGAALGDSEYKQTYIRHKERAQGVLVAVMELLRSLRRCEFDSLDIRGAAKQ